MVGGKFFNKSVKFIRFFLSQSFSLLDLSFIGSSLRSRPVIADSHLAVMG